MSPLWNLILRALPLEILPKVSQITRLACFCFVGLVRSSVTRSPSCLLPAGIEKACRHFCTAAGILNYIKTEVSTRLIGTLPYDLTSEGLTMLMNVQLAQAQACYYEMAQNAGKKPETLAKIAGQAGDLYRAASRSMADAAFADIDATYPWSVFLRMHAASFDSASFWQQSHTARAEADAKGDGYGLEISWLTVAENAGRAAVNIVASSKNPLAARLDVTNTSLLINKVHGRRVEAEKDNNTIYCKCVSFLLCTILLVFFVACF
jgi:BRO1-like domain